MSETNTPDNSNPKPIGEILEEAGGAEGLVGDMGGFGDRAAEKERDEIEGDEADADSREADWKEQVEGGYEMDPEAKPPRVRGEEEQIDRNTRTKDQLDAEERLRAKGITDPTAERVLKEAEQMGREIVEEATHGTSVSRATRIAEQHEEQATDEASQNHPGVIEEQSGGKPEAE